MKKTLVLLFILVITFSCAKQKKEKNFKIGVCQGDNFNYTVTYVECDSFQMVSSNEAFIWSDGRKMKLIGDRGLKPESN
ncbi:hypothetical protein EBQ93_03535 [bacterium]|nr:hypothetical protein [bacterium]